MRTLAATCLSVGKLLAASVLAASAIVVSVSYATEQWNPDKTVTQAGWECSYAFWEPHKEDIPHSSSEEIKATPRYTGVIQSGPADKYVTYEKNGIRMAATSELFYGRIVIPLVGKREATNEVLPIEAQPPDKSGWRSTRFKHEGKWPSAANKVEHDDKGAPVSIGIGGLFDSDEWKCHVPLLTGNSTIPLPDEPLAMVSEFHEGGILALDENYQPYKDETGEWVLTIEPSLFARFTSTVEQLETTTRFTYTIENLSGIDREFAFPEITSEHYPDGWSGTVYANSSATTDVEVLTEEEGVHVQNTQADLANAELNYMTASPVPMYVPESRLSFGGTTEAISATYIADPRSVSVTFAVDGATASEAVLYRATSEGIVRIAHIVGEFAPEQNYEIVDPSPDAGTAEYTVVAGNGTNGIASSEPATVDVP